MAAGVDDMPAWPRQAGLAGTGAAAAVTIGAAPALRGRGGQRSPTSRCKQLLLGLPLATAAARRRS
jgi:hypothetical protein